MFRLARLSDPCGNASMWVWAETTYIVVVLPTQINCIYVHTAIVGPVVSERDEQLDADFGGRIDDLIKGLDIDRGGTVGEALEDDLGVAGPFASILR